MITKEFTVWCNYCAKWEQLGHQTTKARFIKTILKSGDWVRFRGDWYCKSCDEELKEEQNGGEG